LRPVFYVSVIISRLINAFAGVYISGYFKFFLTKNEPFLTKIVIKCIGGDAVYLPDEIFERFIKGDIEAMSTLVDAYKNELFNFCFRLTFNRQDAEDLFQQTWIKAVRKAAQYENKNFRPWLFKICVNQFRDNCKEISRRRKHIVEDFETTSVKDYVLMSAGSDETVEDQVEKRQIQALLVSRIAKLPEHQKVPMVLFYYQQMKLSEIAGVLGVPEGTVKSRISIAKSRLKSELESELYV
jgi:RNA polymerase sigma-70 factor, ECF subfamily